MTDIQDEEISFGNHKNCLNKIFNEIVEQNSSMKIHLGVISDLILNDLKLNLDHLTHSQLATLPYMLVNYIKKWPGWEKRVEYENGSMDIESWYKRFRHYVLYKMTLLITKTLSSVESNLELEAKEIKQVTSSTQLSNRASFANFNIDIAGPACLLSNLVFWGFGDSISVEAHSDRPWVPLDVIQLVNYPYVEVEFNSPELSFKRSFEPRINRYISGCADLLYEKTNFILGKHRINTKTSKFVFPTSLLNEYIESYKESMFPQISLQQQEEVGVILNQFYEDMVDINSDNLVAENRQVSFNIGRNIFKRSKKISNQQNEDLGPSVIFNEVFLPKIVSSFRYFTGMQEYTLEGKRIISSKKNGSKMMMNFKPIIIYKCTYCKVNYDGPCGRDKILTHLEITHKREQPLLCLFCKKSFEVTNLSKQRWKCVCQQ